MQSTIFRQRILRATVATTLCAVFPAWACEYYADHFQIIHPASQPAQAGASAVAISLQFTQIESTDRLLGASTPVADRVEVITQGGEQQGIELAPGRELSLSPMGNYLVMHGVNTQLHHSRQYPLTLIFEKAGAVDVEFIVGDH